MNTVHVLVDDPEEEVPAECTDETELGDLDTSFDCVGYVDELVEVGHTQEALGL